MATLAGGPEPEVLWEDGEITRRQQAASATARARSELLWDDNDVDVEDEGFRADDGSFSSSDDEDFLLLHEREEPKWYA